MRGKENRFRLSQMKRRITPAYAGKSVTNTSKQLLQGDHPRVCGEKNTL